MLHPGFPPGSPASSYSMHAVCSLLLMITAFFLPIFWRKTISAALRVILQARSALIKLNQIKVFARECDYNEFDLFCILFTPISFNIFAIH